MALKKVDLSQVYASASGLIGSQDIAGNGTGMAALMTPSHSPSVPSPSGP